MTAQPEDVMQYYGEDAIDVTEVVELYENGKVIECPNCGAGTGIRKDLVTHKCHGCNRILVDTEAHLREDQEFNVGSGGQMKLGDFA